LDINFKEAIASLKLSHDVNVAHLVWRV
jgi:hypothetical protein